jgi:DNA (cytosine-5)-methyltransferase 1
MKIIDLFAGIGGFSLAGHWAGFETAAFVEWEEYPQKVLRKNFPNVPIFCDIREFDGTKYRDTVDIITGGFPCQPFSTAGKRQGASDDRYLWPEMLRVIRQVKPTWVIGENVAGLVSMDNGVVLEEVCTSLEGEGYAVQPFIIPAIGKGAPHKRDRIWIVAHSEKERRRKKGQYFGRFEERITGANTTPPTNPGNILHSGELDSGRTQSKAGGSKTGEFKKGQPNGERVRVGSGKCGEFIGNTSRRTTQGPDGVCKPKGPSDRYRGGTWQRNWHEVATELCRVDDGLSRRVDRNRANRLKALGNSIVPQIAFELFEAIKAQ